MMSGSIEIKLKLLSAETFTVNIPKPRDLIDDAKFCLRVIALTSSCVGLGLDSSSVCVSIRVGFPENVLSMMEKWVVVEELATTMGLIQHMIFFVSVLTMLHMP